MSDDQDWRLQAELAGSEQPHGVLVRLHAAAGEGAGGAAAEAQEAVGDAAAITHDGRLLFAYANDQSSLNAVRRTIESVLERDGLKATITVSHWDDELDEWHQIDPPLGGQAARAQEQSEAAAERVETRTMVANVGKALQASMERGMLDWAQKLGVDCRLVEHPHLLTTQVAFTVTGPRHKLDEFRRALDAEGWASIRADGFGTGLI